MIKHHCDLCGSEVPQPGLARFPSVMSNTDPNIRLELKAERRITAEERTMALALLSNPAMPASAAEGVTAPSFCAYCLVQLTQNIIDKIKHTPEWKNNMIQNSP